MSKYRDDLDAAKYRVAHLEERLLEREAEIATLRQKADDVARAKPESPQGPGASPVRSIMFAVGIVVVTGGFIAHLTALETAPQPPRLHELSDFATLLSLPPVPSHHTGATRLPAMDETRASRVVNPRRPDDCSPRHGYTDAKSLPKDTAFISFDGCHGCSCCSATGELPPVFRPGQSEPDPMFSECIHCTTEVSLESAGISIAGASPTTHGNLTANANLVLDVNLDKTVSVFGVRVEPTVLVSSHPSRGGANQKPPNTMGTTTLVGFDAEDRVADVAVATYDRTFTGGPDTVPDYASRSRFLAVEACDGVTLSRVEIRFSDTNMIVDDFAVQPPIPR